MNIINIYKQQYGLQKSKEYQHSWYGSIDIPNIAIINVSNQAFNVNDKIIKPGDITYISESIVNTFNSMFKRPVFLKC